MTKNYTKEDNIEEESNNEEKDNMNEFINKILEGQKSLENKLDDISLELQIIRTELKKR